MARAPTEDACWNYRRDSNLLIGVSNNSDLNHGDQEADEEGKDEKKVAQSGNNVSLGCPQILLFSLRERWSATE